MVYLFQPPFDKTNLEPGYIKGYPPGIRENGGQYTHAAIWLAMAYAKNNDHQTSLKMMTMLNPIMHSLDTEQVERYKGEPYVIAADVYSSKTQMGMAGWTWYTGSASWYYRAFIESILGVRRRGDELLFHPIDDENFFEFEINYCFGKSHYHIAIEKTDKLAGIYVDDKYISESLVLPLVDDNQNHVVIVKIL